MFRDMFVNKDYDNEQSQKNRTVCAESKVLWYILDNL